MKDIRNSKVLKTICYLLVPILILIILASGFSLIYYSEYEQDFMENKNYIDSQRFADKYFDEILRSVRIVERENAIIETDNTNQDKNNIQYNNDTLNLTQNAQNIQYNFYTIPDYNILIISPNGEIITNVPKNTATDTIEEIKDYICNQKYFWIYNKNGVKTNISKLQYDEIAYYGLEKIQDSNYEIYTSVIEKNGGEWYRYNLLYNFVANTSLIAPFSIGISSILLLACIIYIFISIGHKQGSEKIYIDSFDKIQYEVILLLFGILLSIGIFGLAGTIELVINSFSKIIINTGITLGIAISFVIYSIVAVFLVTSIRRIKAHVFWKNTFIYQFFKFVFKGLFTNLSQTVKLAVEYGIFIIASFILTFITMQMPICIILLLGFWYYIFKKILNQINQFNKVREKIGKMYKGDITKPLNEEELYGELRQVAKELNDISGGLSNAIEEATKSERLKTELITNVSHDIKTPLTSIINYVDLIKQEEIENPKIQEYLEILESKSQRLKKLTEDLIEASKASSGNIKLTMEKLNVKELIKQVDGEFKDRFNKRGLEVIENYPDEDVNITADSRYLYRVMENVYGNIAKYALENSRVYIDVIKENKKVKIILKNISQDKLNITVDELMQRFVRGDVSRTTEGSGLGISIAKSLTELQNGKFDIYLDGDLFKVVIEF